MSDPFEVAVIGGGIVGLATAHALAATGHSVVVLDKEPGLATHQTGRNSGVIHAGLYYAPGSLKARLSVEGGRRLFSFCSEHGIATTQTGKVVLATDAAQLDALAELERRARANGVQTRRLSPVDIGEIEPHAVGVAGLHVPTTGAVDFGEVARALARLIEERGGEIHTGFEVVAARRGEGQWSLLGSVDEVRARTVVNCAGLHVDRVAKMMGADVGDLRILPFRGEYWGLTSQASALVRGNLYPVPDARFPHLGVHFTRSVAGNVEVGPNAVWAWGREAYGRASLDVGDAIDTLSYRGFWNLARRHWRTGVGEQWRSWNRRAFVRNARAMLPELTIDDLVGWRSGIRAQAVARDGTLIHDFVIRHSEGAVHVLNAPSPAATACLTIGEHIAALAFRTMP